MKTWFFSSKKRTSKLQLKRTPIKFYLSHIIRTSLRSQWSDHKLWVAEAAFAAELFYGQGFWVLFADCKSTNHTTEQSHNQSLSFRDHLT